MITETQNKEARLDFFSSLYQNAKSSYSEYIEAYEKNLKQYRGDDAIDGGERALTVRNITYEIIESQVSSDIPSPKVDPSCYSEKRDRNAKAIERLLYSVRDRLPFEEMNDTDERYTYIYGSSIWYVEWDNSIKLGAEVGGVRVYCISPENFIPQPSITDIEDMEYCFLKFTTTRAELTRRFEIEDEEAELMEFDFNANDSENDTVNMIVAFYKDEDGDVGKFVFSGGATLLDMPKLYKRKVKMCKKCGLTHEKCECRQPALCRIDLEYESVSDKLSLGDGEWITDFSPLVEDGRPIPDKDGYVMKKTEIPYYTPKRFPIAVRKNISRFGSLFGQSDCEYIRPEQQAINKIESRILQKLLRAGITPIVPEDASITLNNSVFGQIIKMKPGESASQYGKVDTTPDISQDIAEAERLYDHSKRTLGISDALQGLDTKSAESGYSRQLKISQATGRLESKRKMKHTLYASLDRLIFEQYLAFADEPRALIYKDAYGRIHNSEFNRYAFLEYDTTLGVYYYDDAYLFSVDLNGGAEYQREALWERNLENLRAGTLGDPKSPATLLRYWQCQERAHYPYARENVEYFLLEVEKRKEESVIENGTYA